MLPNLAEGDNTTIRYCCTAAHKVHSSNVYENVFLFFSNMLFERLATSSNSNKQFNEVNNSKLLRIYDPSPVMG